MIKNIKTKKGISLITVTLFLGLFFLVVTSMLTILLSNMTVIRNLMRQKELFYISEGGLEYGYLDIKGKQPGYEYNNNFDVNNTSLKIKIEGLVSRIPRDEAKSLVLSQHNPIVLPFYKDGGMENIDEIDLNLGNFEFECGCNPMSDNIIKWTVMGKDSEDNWEAIGGNKDIVNNQFTINKEQAEDTIIPRNISDFVNQYTNNIFKIDYYGEGECECVMDYTHLNDGEFANKDFVIISSATKNDYMQVTQGIVPWQRISPLFYYAIISF